MDRSKLRTIVADAVGNPSSGPVADAIDEIVDAVIAAGSPRETRVTKATETRGE